MAELLKGLETKGVDTGVDAGVSAAKKGGNAVLDVAKDESRKVAIKITNKSNQKWTKPRIFLDCGTAEDLLPLEVENETEVNYEIHKQKWRLSGIAGVITYEWVADGKKYSLAVMFRSPMTTSNNWNAELYSETTEGASEQLFSTLTHGGAIKGDNNYTTKEFGLYTLEGAMSSSGTAKLNVNVTYTPETEAAETSGGQAQAEP